MHGKTSMVHHDGKGVFRKLPSPYEVTRYHSLVIDRQTLPGELMIDAEAPDGAIMAVSHRERPLYGIQFHPESFGTASGDQLILNFLGGLS